MDRREFVSCLGWGAMSGLLGASLNLSGRRAMGAESSMAEPDTELIMLIWCAHSMGGPEDFGPDRVREWVALCADLGVTTIFWRGSYVGKATYHSKVLPVMKHLEEDYFEKQGLDREYWEATRLGFNRKAEAIKDFDSLDVALVEAKKRGIKFYGDVALFDMYFAGLENDFFDEHPQYWLLARDQETRWRGLPCYAERGAQDYRLAEIQELLDRGVDGISYYLESHAGDGGGGLGPDAFAFNPAVVEAYQQDYGVNILKDEFDPDTLSRLNGRMFTGFLRRIRELLGPQRRFVAATTDIGYAGYGGPGGAQVSARFIAGGRVRHIPRYRFNLEWRKWIREGIADDLMVYAPMPDAVHNAQRAVKSRLSKGRVFLWREVDQAEHLEDYRKELAAIRAGALDGYVMDELISFMSAGSLGRQVLATS